MILQLQIGLADLVELLVGVRQHTQGRLQAARVRQEVEEKQEVFSFLRENHKNAYDNYTKSVIV